VVGDKDKKKMKEKIKKKKGARKWRCYIPSYLVKYLTSPIIRKLPKYSSIHWWYQCGCWFTQSDELKNKHVNIFILFYVFSLKLKFFLVCPN
jgi:hypothetical protein